MCLDSRIRMLYRPSGLSIDLVTTPTPMPSTLRHKDTAIPSDIPETFIQGWYEAIEDRSSKLAAEATAAPVTPTSTPTPCKPMMTFRDNSLTPAVTEYDFSKPSRPADYAAAQTSNGTVTYILSNVINLIINRPLGFKDHEIMDGATYGNIITYTKLLSRRLCS